MQNFKNPIFQKRHYEFVADILKELKKFEEDNQKKCDRDLDIEKESNYKMVIDNQEVDEINESDYVFHLSLEDIIKKFTDKFIKISPKNDDGKPLFDKQKFLDRIGVK